MEAGREISCKQCGYCCRYMGDVFGIIEELGACEYRIQYLITGVCQMVRIDTDKKELFSTTSILDKHPLACPFLRKREDGSIICTVYQTRPELCRMYQCDQYNRHRSPITN